MSDGTSSSPGRGVLTSRVFWAGYGVVMAAVGARLPAWDWPPSVDKIVVLAVCALVFAGLAQPYLGRPVPASMRLHHVALVHRNTLLVALFVAVVAAQKPPAWVAGLDALVLAGYLLLTDAITMPAAMLRRIASPASLLALAGLIAGATALVGLPASTAEYRPILVAGAAAAALGAAVATAFGSGEERRVGSRGTERQNQDRSSE
jgi:hypothetical protein